MRRAFVVPLMVFALAVPASTAAKYAGPRPPKPDVPYLLHASRLVETEVTEAKEEKRKNETVYAVSGTDSPARTPLAEPIFLLETQKLQAERLELYKLELRNGRREAVFPEKKKRDAPRPIRLSVTRLDQNLYRLETTAGLENGEYSLTPPGSNQVFCFQVY
ncbi:MAG: hypothetical protein GYA57_09325 [Myxococcales bacterium]|nr:hypothetical protein [Myxococcales bacterium]